MSFARKFANWYIVSEVDDGLDLKDKQEDILEDKVEAHLDWFDKKYSKDIVSYLDLIIQKTQTTLSDQTVHDLYERYKVLRKKLFDRIAPDLGWLLASLDEKQKQSFKTFLEERNENLIELLEEDDDDFRDDVLEKRIEGLEDWFGDLREEQIEAFKSLWQINRSRHVNWLEWRRARQARIHSLTSGRTEVEISQTIARWGHSPAEMYPQHIQEKLKIAEKRTGSLVPKIFNTMDIHQRSHFHKKLREIIEELKSLATH